MISLPYQILAGVVICAFLTLYGYHWGASDMQKEWDAAVSNARANNIKINTEVSDDLQKNYTALRKRYDAMRVRYAGDLRASDTTSGHNAAAPRIGLPWQVYEPLAALMLQADLQTQQLIGCQNWIRKLSE